MPGRRYPPEDDQGILDAGKQFAENLDDPAVIGLSADDLSRLSDANADGQAKFNANNTIQAQAKTATQEKIDGIGLISSILSEFNGRTQKHPGMNDALRTKLGLPIYDAVKSKTPVPDEQPSVEIETNVPLMHTLRFPTKPEGADFLGIWLKIGGKATGELKDYQFQAQDRTSPYLMQFDVSNSGEQAHYMCCWMNNDGDRGAFRMISATITSELQEKT